MSTTPAVFSGLRVLDFSWGAVGPLTVRYLADHGAIVVRVESVTKFIERYLPPWLGGDFDVNGSVVSMSWNANKLGLGANLARPDGRAVVRRLIAEWHPDVLVESMVPGTMAKLGLDYAAVSELIPNIIYLSTSQHGQTGPHAPFGGYGNLAAAMAGFDFLTGWPDRSPLPIYGAYTDEVNPPLAVSTIIAALLHRAQTGEGQYIDLSQREAAVHYLAPALLDYQLNGRVATRQGNADPHYAPHGVYPGRNHESWIALAIQSDAEWEALAETLNRPDWIEDSRFATFLARRRNQAALDEELAAATREQAVETLEAALQQRGIAAGRVNNGFDMHADPQLGALGYFQKRPAGPGQEYVHQDFMVRLSETPSVFQRSYVGIGWDNFQILSEFAHYPDEEIAELIADGAVESS